MMAAKKYDVSRMPEYAYHLLRSALEQFGKTPSQLEPTQTHKVKKQADATYDLESRVLASPEAGDVVIPEQRVDEALAEVAGRYSDRDEFLADLEANNLDESLLRTALLRELRFDAVMERVGARSAAISDLDVRLFYEAHRDRFQRPETRTARHLLLTVNPDFPENTCETALARIEDIARRLRQNPKRFAELARTHSECPSAMEGGKLGRLPRGKLYPELDQALFELEQGGVSGVVETELGLHLIYCEKIHPAKPVPIAEARMRIREIMEQRRRRQCQRAWLAALQNDEAKGKSDG